MTREPSAAGTFYPSQKERLQEILESLFNKVPEQEKTSCVIAPHAGYNYSGKTAAYSYNALKESNTFVLLSPSHTGLGPNTSLSDASQWQTPLGKIPVNIALIEQLAKKLSLQPDDLAHIQEHSIEVQLPFLQFKFKKFSILPITIMEHSLPELKKLGNALAELNTDFSVIASGDFTHFEPLETAKQKDQAAIKKIEALDLEGFYSEVTAKNLSICGLSPITALLQYCKQKKFKKAKLLHYDTSASFQGDKASVVGYAAIGIY